jgi:aminopeptidase N
MVEKNVFTKEDTVRGSITEFRRGWDVLKYDLTVQPDIIAKKITGKNIITYKEDSPVKIMQIDLQQPLEIDSITGENNNHFSYKRQNNVCLVAIRDSTQTNEFKPDVHTIVVYYHGEPKEAKRPPWDGGFVWKTDENNNPFIATACQGVGASIWWPCKDHQSDEPDSGMNITLIAPDTLCAVSNGRLKNVSASINGMKSWRWEVKNPINLYGVTMNIGKYVSWNDTLMGENGKLDLEYWVLDYNFEKARKQFAQVKPMLRTHEYWFGKYPFYEDSYKLVEAPFLGMEHQSAVAYGNKYQNGYGGKDLSGTGWGLKWDFIIVHESGHEWFGNNVTAKDIADMWIHEGFTNYSETLYTEKMFGKEAADEYNYGIRRNIKNDRNIIGYYGVNKEGSVDMYYKAGNMIHMIRQTMQNDSTFRSILRGLNSTFYHQTVTTKQIEDYISNEAKFDFSKLFDQYLRTRQIPVFQFYLSKNRRKLFFRWSNCVNGFNLPIYVSDNDINLTFNATETWKNVPVSKKLIASQLADVIEKKYYIAIKPLKSNPKF